jgi:hypothetical protein
MYVVFPPSSEMCVRAENFSALTSTRGLVFVTGLQQMFTIIVSAKIE